MVNLKNLLRPYYKRLLSGVIVLCYHRVSEVTTDCWQNVISPDNFRKHLELIKKYYQPASLGELVQSIENGTLPDRRTVIITFDDGYSSNLKYACPLLTEFKIPAIFYINTYTLENDTLFWWDELQNILIDIPKQLDVPSQLVLSNELALPYRTSVQKAYSFSILHKILKSLDSSTRSRVLFTLKEQVGEHLPLSLIKEREPISKNGVKTLAKSSLFEIGGHSHSHQALSLLSLDTQRFEIQENKKRLEKIIGRTVEHFSYPFGGNDDFDENTIDLLKACGYKSAVTTQRQPLRLGGNLYRIPRISVKNWGGGEFKNKLSQFWTQ
jgi:peptidoglycan/xylan/chitin deacetylase (PgdA/CDA1 family)